MLTMSWHGALRDGAFCRAVNPYGLALFFCFNLRAPRDGHQSISNGGAALSTAIPGPGEEDKGMDQCIEPDAGAWLT